MKIVAIHQPNYLPWAGYFYKILKCDTFVFLDNVQYEKSSFINRNRIKTSQGAAWLTVDVITKNRFGQFINEVEINNRVSWAKKHWRSISQNYSKAPNFDAYRDFFENTYQRNWEKLVDLNKYLIVAICEIIGIKDTTILDASELDVQGKGTELLINTSKAVNADVYLSGFGGAKYMEEDAFNNAGIKLKYYDFKHPVYTQLFGEFIPNLSIIDLLFNEGEKSIQILRGI
ncbi:MAG: WbqC family protein [Candidatus Aminicenantaceae bacterium]